MTLLIKSDFPLPLPRIIHNIRTPGAAKSCAKRGRACLAAKGVKTFGTEEPDEGNHIVVDYSELEEPVIVTSYVPDSRHWVKYQIRKK